MAGGVIHQADERARRELSLQLLDDGDDGQDVQERAEAAALLTTLLALEHVVTEELRRLVSIQSVKIGQQRPQVSISVELISMHT